MTMVVEVAEEANTEAEEAMIMLPTLDKAEVIRVTIVDKVLEMEALHDTTTIRFISIYFFFQWWENIEVCLIF